MTWGGSFMNKRAFTMASITIILWASSFAGIKASLLGGYSPTHLVLVRFLVASSIFIILGLLPYPYYSLCQAYGVIYRIQPLQHIYLQYLLVFSLRRLLTRIGLWLSHQ